MPELSSIIGTLKLLVLASVLFVWFVRYDNIVKEFIEYKYPNWLRDRRYIKSLLCVHVAIA